MAAVKEGVLSGLLTQMTPAAANKYQWVQRASVSVVKVWRAWGRTTSLPDDSDGIVGWWKEHKLTGSP